MYIMCKLINYLLVYNIDSVKHFTKNIHLLFLPNYKIVQKIITSNINFMSPTIQFHVFISAFLRYVTCI